jgi:hypothetical protein
MWHASQSVCGAAIKVLCVANAWFWPCCHRPGKKVPALCPKKPLEPNAAGGAKIQIGLLLSKSQSLLLAQGLIVLMRAAIQVRKCLGLAPP